MAREPGELLLVEAKDVSADWGKFLRSIGSAIGKAGWTAATGDVVAGVTALGDLVGASDAFTFGDGSPAAIAHGWLSTALILGGTSILGEAMADAATKNDAKSLKAAAKIVFMQDIVIDRGFFEEPRRLPLLKHAAEHLAALLEPVLEPEVAARRAALLPAEFHRHLEALRAAKPSRYTDVFNAVGAREDDLIASWRRAQDWDDYNRSFIKQEYRRPLFGDGSPNLGQVYVPLRGGVELPGQTEKPDEFDFDAPRDLPQRERPQMRAVQLDEDFLAWLADDDTKEPVRLVTGGPGSGKSSFMKHLGHSVASLAHSPDAWHVLFFRLHSNTFEFHGGNLRDAMRAYWAANHFKHGHDPLEPPDGANAPPLLLLFDGLDELALSGTDAARDLAQSLLSTVWNLVDGYGKAGRRVRAVISGRDIVMDHAIRRFSDVGRQQLYAVQPYALNDSEKERFESIPDYLVLDQRDAAWQRYSEAMGLAMEPPPVMKSERFDELTKEPLLHAFMTQAREKLAALDAETANRTLVYRAVFAKTFERELTERKPGFRVFIRDGEDPALDRAKIEGRFNLGLETMALAAFRHGSLRRAGTERVRQAFNEAKLEYLLTGFAEGVGGLAASFFVRRAEEGGGIEFTHRTFGEYLYARRLARWVQDAAARLIADDGDSDTVHIWLERWHKLAAEHRMSETVLGFLQEELADRLQRAQNELGSWHQALQELVEKALAIGWQSSESQRASERQSFNAEEALFCVWTKLWMLAGGDERWKLAAFDGEWVGRFLGRMVSVYGPFAGFEGALCSCLHGANLFGANLFGANLFGANLFGANLFGANLQRADLRDADLQNADLFGADLFGADLQRADLRDADLRDSDLRGANLQRANLRDADFQRADFQRADLRDADLWDADLRGANLNGIRLLKPLAETGAIIDETTRGKDSVRVEEL